MGRGGEGAIEEKREGEKKDNAGGKDREKGKNYILSSYILSRKKQNSGNVM